MESAGRGQRLVMFTPGHAEPGGAARRSRLLAQGLAARGWDVRVVTRAGTLRRILLSRTPNLTVVEVPGFRMRRLGALLFVASGLVLGTAWGTRATAFVAVQLASPVSAAALCATLCRRPYIALTTTSGHLSEAAYARTGPLSRLRRRLLSRASFVAAQTSSVAAELEKLVQPDRVVVVPNPVERVAGLALTGAPRAIFTGRLSAEKDLFRLMEAWRLIASERDDVLLTVAGDGGNYRPVERELREVVAKDERLERTVRLTGWVEDVRPFLYDADVFVLPSLSEGMSNSLLEACAAGRIVVASDIPANRSVLGDDYPLLFAAGDTASLVDALRRAFDDNGVRDAALETISQRIVTFSVDAVVTQLEELVRIAAAPSSASGGAQRRRGARRRLGVG